MGFKDYKSDTPVIWCAGCGLYGAYTSTLRVFDKLKIKKNDLVVVSGIGCSGRFSTYIDAYTLHTTHGRALPHAEGIKVANPNLEVVVVSGDGDALAIGGNHFIHAARRNIDLTYLVLNNNIYGMTGGQTSPTTSHDYITVSAPYGNIEQPIEICDFAIAAGATYVARGSTVHQNQLDDLILEAMNHKGFSVVEIRFGCVEIFGRRAHMDSSELKDYERSILTFDANDKSKIFLGKIHQDNVKKEYTDLIEEIKTRAKKEGMSRDELLRSDLEKFK